VENPCLTRLALNLRLAPAHRANAGLIAFVLAAAAALAALSTARRPRAA